MGIESVMETVIGLALFASAFALLGFVIGEMHGRIPKQKRDGRGRFISNSKSKGEWHTAKGANYDPLFYDVDENL